MISFYPGPSKVYPEVPAYVQDAYAEGLLSANHRSPEFIALCQKTIRLLKEKLQVPEEYMVFFASSATECWEIISQSLVQKESCHIYNGAFGEKWFQYAEKLQPRAQGHQFDIQESLTIEDYQIHDEVELIALTHNETSNGTALQQDWIADTKRKYPDKLLAIDATSSMAGVHLDFNKADIWYASVQKCFGLPAGMAVMICSPQALEKAVQLGERKHYNSLQYMREMMDKWQTTYTPNVLNIYLLSRVLEARPGIQETESVILRRYEQWIKLIHSLDYLSLMVKDEAYRSKTVVPLVAEKEVIDKLRAESKKAGITIGNGYGVWKEKSLRIANFPALEGWEIEKLVNFLKSFSV